MSTLTEHRPPLAAFPKAWMDPLCRTGTMRLEEWIELSGKLDVDGLEFYSGFLDLEDRRTWKDYRRQVEDQGRRIPMLCCSPDFTHPDPTFRQEQVDREKGWIDMIYELGGDYCRILSGQRRPEVSIEQGLQWCQSCIEDCLSHAEQAGVTLIIENHYKDNYWDYPEFAQHMEVFCQLLDRVQHERFRVNYDPSNTLLAGEDPLELLDRVKGRVATMHASDRFLKKGTLEDLQKEPPREGYSSLLSHGVIGKGLNDYDAIFSTLKEAGFHGWVSIEDGEDGMEAMVESVVFLREKLAEHWS